MCMRRQAVYCHQQPNSPANRAFIIPPARLAKKKRKVNSSHERILAQIFGMCIDFDTIAHPLVTKISTAGWNSNNPEPTVPSGRASRSHPFEAQYAINDTMESVVGIGVPSKYLDLPVASLGSDCTVTLKRARRERPQRTKNVRRTVSRKVRKPRAKAQEAGAIPKEI